MSIFVVQYSKNDVALNINFGKDLSEYLPHLPKEVAMYNFGASKAAVFYYGSALDREVEVIGENEAVICQGYGDDALEKRIRAAFFRNEPLDLIKFPEAFCAVRFHKDGVEFSTSAVGVDPLFFFEDDNQLVVTNRHNLLGPWAENTPLRKQAFYWMVGRGHVGDFGTIWEKINKTRPGWLYKYNSFGFEKAPADYSDLFDPIEDVDINQRVNEVSETFCEIIDKNSSQLRFWLSGGKDSRAIAGLLSKADRFKDITFSTHGELFSPDVMSASVVAKQLGVANKFSTSRASLTEPAVDLAKAISKDLLSDSIGGSLADFKSIPISDLFVIGGHGAYKVPPNKLELDVYLESRRYWADNHSVLTAEAYKEINDWYKRELGDVLSDIPKSKYPQLEALVFLIGTRTAASHVSSHVSTSQVHPFQDGRMIRLLFGVSDRAVENQMIHYLMMRQSDSFLESLPFASDYWPEGTVSHAKEIGLPFREFPQAPYKFQNYFPSQSVFGGYSWRLQLIERSKDFVLRYLMDNKEFFDFLDMRRVEEIAQRDVSSLKVSTIYYQLGLLKACLSHYFGKRGMLFKFSNESLISDVVADFFDTTRTNSTSKEEVINRYKVKLDDYEMAISKVAERDRKEESFEEKRVNARLASKLVPLMISDEGRLAAEIEELGFSMLPKGGVKLGRLGDARNLSGYAINLSEKENTLLVALKGLPDTFSSNIFNWSEAGGFWFKYVNPSIQDARLNLELPSDCGSAEVWIIPWYSDRPIFVYGLELE